jgi:hypothetical protein
MNEQPTMGIQGHRVTRRPGKMQVANWLRAGHQIAGTTDMDWKEAIPGLRTLREKAQQRRLWASIPRKVASGMGFKVEPVDLPMLEAERVRRPMPRVPAKPAPTA